MSDFGFEEPMAIDDLRGEVGGDTPCRNCSYNLRGLPKEGRCPECGTAVGVSICGELLQFSHPRWLRQVGDGLMMVLWGLLLSVVVGFVVGLTMNGDPAIRQMLVTLGSLAGVIGTWQMTAPDPSGIGERPGMTARKLVRIAVMAGLAANVLQIVAGTGRQVVAIALFSGLCGLVGLVGEFAKLHYIGVLANRIPNDALRDRANFLKWAMAICYGVMLVLGVIVAVSAMAAISGRLNGGGAGGAAVGLAATGCLMMPLVLAMLVFAIMALMLIYRTSQAIKALVPVSMDLWTRAAKQQAGKREGKAGL